MIDESTSGLVIPAQSTSMHVLLLHLVIADVNVLCKASCVVVSHLTILTISHAALLPL